MVTRILSFLLALSLLWSASLATGVGAQAADAPLGVGMASVLSQPAPQAPSGLESAGPDQHSPVDTALGEPPAQGLLETAAEPVALFTPVPRAPTSPLTMAQPRAPAVEAWLSPHLDGLRRPPRPTALVG